MEVINPVIEVWVPGLPAPAGSKKGFYVKKIKRVVITDDCKRSKPWMATVKHFAFAAWGDRPPLEGAVRLEVVFRLPRPKGHYRSGRNASQVRPSAPLYPMVKPDATKLLRAVEDALTGILWRDDAQVVHQTVEKVYSATPGAVIRVEAIRDPIRQQAASRVLPGMGGEGEATP